MKPRTIASSAGSIFLVYLALSFLSSSGAPATSQDVARQEFNQLKREVSDLRNSFEGLADAGTKTKETVAFLSLTSPPVGTVLSFAGVWPPRKNDTQNYSEQELGWMLCDGRSLTQAQFKELVVVIGTSWGGDATNFNLPDLRGQFLRGVDDSPNTNSLGTRIGASGNDPERDERRAAKAGGGSGNKVGSAQDDDFKSHYHSIGPGSESSLLYNVKSGKEFAQLTTPAPGSMGLVSATARTQDRGGVTGKETRPKNVYVHYIIKVK